MCGGIHSSDGAYHKSWYMGHMVDPTSLVQVIPLFRIQGFCLDNSSRSKSNDGIF